MRSIDQHDSCIDKQKLSQFKSFEALSDEDYECLISAGKFTVFDAGETVLVVDAEPQKVCLFLIDGEVRLDTPLGTTEATIKATNRLRTPMNFACPPSVTIKANTQITVLTIDTEDYEAIAGKAAPLPSVPNDDYSQSSLLTAVLQSIMTENVKVPSLPEVALKIRAAIDDPDSSIASISALISQDAAIAARLIKVGNSARYAGLSPIKNLTEAVSRLGLTTTRDLVIALSLSNLFQSKQPWLRQYLKEVWVSSISTAVMASVMARDIRGLSPDTAFLTGLLHSIGSIPIISEAENNKALENDPCHLEDCIETLSGQIGNIILLAWGFPMDIACVPLEFDNWQRNPGPQVDYADLVLLSKLQQMAGTFDAESAPAMNEVPAWNKIDLGDFSSETGASWFEDKATIIQSEIDELTT